MSVAPFMTRRLPPSSDAAQLERVELIMRKTTLEPDTCSGPVFAFASLLHRKVRCRRVIPVQPSSSEHIIVSEFLRSVPVTVR